MRNRMPTCGLIVADVDGTVIGESGAISDAAVRAVARAHAAGWHVSLATGRMPGRARPIASKLGVPLVICTEGSLIYSLSTERPLLAHAVAPPIIAQASAGLEATRWQYAIATTGFLYARSPEFAHLFAPWADSVQPIQDRPAEGRGLMLVVFGLYEEMERLYQDWRMRFGCRAQFVLEHTGTMPGGGLVKILNPSSEKGQSAVWLAKSLGLTSADIVAFGDWLNDIPLLKRASFSIAPDNAIAEVKALANRVSPHDVDHDFFARELHRILDDQVYRA